MTGNRTTELREMLAKRGVEYRKDDASYTFATHWIDSLGRGCSFIEEVYDGVSKTIFVSEPSARNITPEQAIAATLGSDTKGCENLLWELVGALDVADATDASKKPIVKEYARRIAVTLGSVPDEIELTQSYDAGFRNGVMAVFQQLEGIESYEELQDLIAEYWAEGEGNDER